MQKNKDHYGLCHLSIIPIRASAAQPGEQLSQLLYGDLYKITDHRKDWSKIRVIHDKTEGWILNTQVKAISKTHYKEIKAVKHPAYSNELISFVSEHANHLTPILLGSVVQNAKYLKQTYEGELVSGKSKKENLISTSLQYLNAPYQTGGKTPFGIDSAGLTQMVYKLNGHQLPRSPKEQATKGEVLSFVEESTPGDLAFFDNKEGDIIHVGIIMQNNHLIHAYGSVRIDRLDQTGIYDLEKGTYTHHLRVIKKIL